MEVKDRIELEKCNKQYLIDLILEQQEKIDWVEHYLFTWLNAQQISRQSLRQSAKRKGFKI